MPVYAYKGVSNAGKNLKGTISAENIRAARSRMRTDGVFLTEILETDLRADKANGDTKSASRFHFELPVRVPTTERAIATRQLATLVGAGIPLVESLGALVDQVEHSALKSIFAQVRDKVNEGSSLADALTATGKFDTLYISMIRAGEASGSLDKVLNRIADYLEDQVRLSSRVTSILAYPAFMLAFTGLVVSLLVTIVMPQITTLLLSLGQDLPFYTRVVIAGSDVVRDYWWAILALIALLFLGLRAVGKTARGRATLDRAKLRMPIVGRVVRIVAIARFTRTLSSLLSGGVSIIQSLDIARHVANNTVIADAINSARTSVLEGASLATPLRQSGEFPPMVITMVEVGERAGDLESMLQKVAQTYDEQVETTVTRLTSLMEPVLILIMVGIVLFIILATLMPMLSLTSSLQ